MTYTVSSGTLNSSIPYIHSLTTDDINWQIKQVRLLKDIVIDCIFGFIYNFLQ